MKRKTGDPRLVVDYRKLNAQTKKIPYPTPTIDEQFESLHGCKIFTTLDLSNGFLQIPIDENTKHKTAFITPDETGQFERMMFGLTNGPYEFCRLMNVVLGPLRNKVCTFYIDDVLIGAPDWTEMFRRLRLVFNAFREANLTLKLSKCEFGLKEVQFVGMTVTEGGLKPGKSQCQAIKNFPIPKNQHDLRRFIGMTGYFRRLIPKYAEKARALTELTKQNVNFEWTEVQNHAFEELKRILTEPNVLKLYNPHAEVTELHTDASAVGLAGILMQKDDENQKMYPVYYISKKTTEVEAKYHSSKLELMAVTWCVERLRFLLIGIKFVIVTDCQALMSINKNKTKNAQVYRWLTSLQEYDFTIRHRPGKDMIHVDALSRAPVLDADDTIKCLYRRLEVCTLVDEYEYILLIQYSDEQLRELIQILQKGENERTNEETNMVKNYVLENARLMRKFEENGTEKTLFVIPKTMRKSIVVKHHDMLGHFGLERTVKKIKERYWFPRMRNYVKRHITGCVECLFVNSLKYLEEDNLENYTRTFHQRDHSNVFMLITWDLLSQQKKEIHIYWW